MQGGKVNQGNRQMKKAIPESMFAERDQARLSSLNTWVLDNGVTEIVMKERQFWNFAFLQPPAESPGRRSWGVRFASLTCRRTPRGTSDCTIPAIRT
jgi:hypothetical protein